MRGYVCVGEGGGGGEENKTCISTDLKAHNVFETEQERVKTVLLTRVVE